MFLERRTREVLSCPLVLTGINVHYYVLIPRLGGVLEEINLSDT